MGSASQNRDLSSESEWNSEEARSTPEPGRQQIRRALQEVLRSTPFRTSKQCQDLLRYVVEHSLTANDDLLRERVIGSEVFGRSPDYDTANDPIVRARIAEVRKRLAQYYLHNKIVSGLRIEIPSGSYRAHFKAIAAAETTAPLTSPPLQPDQAASPHPPIAVESLSGATVHSSFLKQRTMWLVAFVLLLLFSAGFFLWNKLPSSQERVFNRFWGPAFHSPMPVLIYTGTNVVYRFTPSFLDQYRQAHRLENIGPEFAVNLSTLKTVDPRDLLVSSNTYVSVGDVSACSAITSMLARHGKRFELRYAGDISAGDLHSAPTVLIGAFNNNWTLDVTKSMRFAFVRGDTIVDRFDKRRSWSVNAKPNGITLDDYAVISRVLLPETGGVLLTAAGIGQYGTQAASEYLTSPQKIAAFTKIAPKDWPEKNIQIVLHVKVVDDAPGPVDVAAVYFW